MADPGRDRRGDPRRPGRGAPLSRAYCTGDWDDEAAARCRAGDDLDGWTQAVLGAASAYLFGAEPGKLPAQLYDVLARTTDDPIRARLAAALARCWAYAGQAARATRFADEAVDRAQRAGGRAVFNAGAVMFHGVTDDTLARAAALLGDPGKAGRLRTRALATPIPSAAWPGT